MTYSFQDMILTLNKFWKKKGCILLQPYDIEMGAGTFHPATALKALGKKTWKAAYVQPSRRPADGRYAENPNRMQLYYQYQVIIKPSPKNIQDIYIESLNAIGINNNINDIRFIEDNWESPTLKATGVGWEVWCNSMEITQFTYFQKIGGFECITTPVEITYGLERLSMIIQKTSNIFNLKWNNNKKNITYGDIYKQNEIELSYYNFEYANIKIIKKQFDFLEEECWKLLYKGLIIPAYEHCLKINHLFNILDARGVISVTERAFYISRIRELAQNCCKYCIYLNKYIKNGIKIK